jgi:hypothetical protein
MVNFQSAPTERVFGIKREASILLDFHNALNC